MEQEQKTIMPGDDPVPVNLASAETASWRNYINTNISPGEMPIYGFYIPLNDIQQIMQYAVGGVRVYGALPVADQLSGMHLYIVPVDGSGNDIITVNSASVIYDTTQPCPPCCGEPNELNSNLEQ